MAGRSHSSFRLDPAGLALAAAALFACDSGPKSRVESEAPDAALPDATAAGGAQTDAEPGGTATPADAAPQPGTDALPAVDAAPPADGAAPGDAAPPPPDAAPGPPEVCNGEDDDLDGVVDEGVANLCGGCGGIPEAGCQAWRVDLTQTAEAAQTLNPNRIVGLQGSVSSLSERDIEGAHCVFQRALAPGPDAHLGIVTLTSPLITLTQVPTFDALAQTIRYDNSPALGPTQVFSAGQVVRVQAGGGQLVPAFDAELIGPMRVEGTAADELQGAIDVIRGTRAEPATLHWAPGAGEADGTLRFFAGGSRSQFNRGGYRGIFHYQLDVRLNDDGEFTVGPALSRLGLSDSSIWVYLRRENYRRLVIGPHAVELTAASRAELRASGNLDAQDPPTFQITSPSPDAPRIEPGLPVTIRWTPPPAEGPLTISLIYGDAEGLESRYVGCEVARPETGELVLPAEATLGWPMEPDATRILTVRQDLATVVVPGQQDHGKITYAYSLLLPLSP
jgi:hypothetical protein